MLKKTYSWIDERFKISPLIEFMRHKTVPIHRHTVWYYMGGVALFLFIVQVVTGILLVLYFFGSVFRPAFLFAVNLLYPFSSYG